MSFQRFAFIGLLAITIGSMGCQEDFILEASLPEPEPALVVNGIFQPDSLIEVYVNTNAPLIGSNKPQAVTNARVAVLADGEVLEVLPYKDLFWLNGGFILTPLPTDSPGNNESNRLVARYKSKTFRPVAGQTYSVEVSAEGYETVTGTDHIPAPVAIQEAVYTPQTASDELGVRGEIRIVFDDPAGEDNYYNLRHHYRTIDTLTTFIISTTSGFELVSNLQDDLFGADPDDLIGDNNPSQIQDDGITFSDAFFDGERKEIVIEVADDICGASTNSPPELQCQQVIEFSTVTQSFHDYHRTLKLQNESLQNPFAEAVRIKTNMSNNIGVFAGMHPAIWIHVQER
ncbi:MAG: DUF4249 domain-containing protein [Bacteroidota bacterium]